MAQIRTTEAHRKGVVSANSMNMKDVNEARDLLVKLGAPVRLFAHPRRAAWRSKERSVLISALVAGALYLVTMNALSLPAQVDVPFKAGNKGSVIEAEFSVAMRKTYTFYLNLYFRKGDGQNRERVRKLAGTGAYRDGRQIDTGLAIPVRLRVERIGNNRVSSILDRMFTDHDREGMAADHFSKLITRIRLEPGRYRARVEALENISELEDISVHFSLLVAHDRGGP